MKSGEREARIGAGLGSLPKAESVIDATPANSDALRSKAESTYQMLKVALKEYRFVPGESSNEHDDLYELETRCALSEKVCMVLADLPYTTSSAWHRTRSTRDVSSKNDIKDAAKSHEQWDGFWSARQSFLFLTIVLPLEQEPPCTDGDGTERED